MEDKITITLTITQLQLETLHTYIDGGMGSSCNDEFNKQMKPIRNKLANRINKCHGYKLIVHGR